MQAAQGRRYKLSRSRLKRGFRSNSPLKPPPAFVFPTNSLFELVFLDTFVN
jgi:hypothetical protein